MPIFTASQHKPNNMCRDIYAEILVVKDYPNGLTRWWLHFLQN